MSFGFLGKPVLHENNAMAGLDVSHRPERFPLTNMNRAESMAPAAPANRSIAEISGRLNELKMIDYFNVIGGSAGTFVD